MKYSAVVLVGLWLLVQSCASAWAVNDGRADPDLLIDGLDTYSSVEAARHACRDAKVVWADRFTGFYYESGEAKFGATPDGSYACEADARKARYWSTDPRASMDGHPGRKFPFDPIFYGS